MTDEQLEQADVVEIIGTKFGEERSWPGSYDHIDDVDDAIIALLGYDPWRLYDERGSNRVLLIDRAAAKAFFDRRPEDRHSAVLRKALADLEKHGAFQPKKGWQRESAELPEGLYEMKGKVYYDCLSCAQRTELEIEIDEFDPAAAYCGGSPRCIP